VYDKVGVVRVPYINRYNIDASITINDYIINFHICTKTGEENAATNLIFFTRIMNNTQTSPNDK
jgi:hypothetical protein